MTDRIRFFWLLQVGKVAVVLGWVLLWLLDGGRGADDKMLGLLAVVGLVLALGTWFIRLTRYGVLGEGADEIPTLVVVGPVPAALDESLSSVRVVVRTPPCCLPGSCCR